MKAIQHVKIGDVIVKDKIAISNETAKLYRAVNGMEEFRQEFNDLQLGKSLLTFFKHFDLLENDKYLRVVNTRIDSELPTQGVINKALLRLAKEESLNEVKNFIERAKAAHDMLGLKNTYNKFQEIENEISVRQEVLDNIESYHTVQIENQGQEDFWNMQLTVGGYIKELRSMIEANKPDGWPGTIANVFGYSPLTGGDVWTCSGPSVIKWIK